jgi:hypothetical protein
VIVGGQPRTTLVMSALRNIVTSKPTPPTSLLGTVLDTEADQLTGSSGGDWFVRSTADKITDPVSVKEDAVTNV